MNDEFAKTLGLESLDQLRDMIKDQIGGQFKQMTQTRVKRLVLDALDETHKFDVPEQLVEQEFKGIWDRVMHDIEHHGRSFEDEGTTEEKAREEYTAIAERRVRLGLVIAEIGNKNDVQVSEEEHQQALIAEVQKYPGQEQQYMTTSATINKRLLVFAHQSLKTKSSTMWLSWLMLKTRLSLKKSW